jgi:hypothetical protein
MNKTHVEASLDKIRAIFEKASARIEALKPGEKVPATELAAQLGKEIGMTGPQLYPTLKFLFDGYPGVDVKRGAHGGIIKQPVVTVDTAAVAASLATALGDEVKS